MTAAARRETAADDSGPLEAPKRRASDREPAPWTIAQVAGVVGMVGVAAGGLGSFAAQSFARGVDAKRLDVIENAVRDHAATLRDHASTVGAFSTRMAVVEANVVTIRESTARIEQAIRDERTERRAQDKGGSR